jgi:hypothetical protein
MKRTTPKQLFAGLVVVASYAVFLAVLTVLPVSMAGCKAANTPLPAGAINATDASLNANLQAAHAGLAQYEADVTAGKHTPDATEKTIINKVIVSLNTADALYQSYHAALVANPAAGEPQQLIDAVMSVTSNLSALQALVQAVK